MRYILYNPRANNGIKPDFLEGVEYIDVIGLDYQKFFDSLAEEDEVVFVGGDGTLNYFINAVDTDNIKNKVYLKPSGSGNDFMNDLNEHDGREILLNGYIKNLPTVYVNGLEKKFINGIGYGIDGYCCEVGDKLRETTTKPVNYTSIAIKGLLFHFKPANATVTVDGKKHTYRKVWLAPTMHGRFYGGGMMVTPEQDRLGKEHTVSTCVMFGSGKLKTLIVFPSIFKGEHVKHTEMVQVLTGREIKVEFDRPTALQIDGETILGVTEYSVSTKVPAKV